MAKTPQPSPQSDDNNEQISSNEIPSDEFTGEVDLSTDELAALSGEPAETPAEPSDGGDDDETIANSGMQSEEDLEAAQVAEAKRIADAAAEESAQQQQNRTVPHAALHEERTARQDLQKKYDDLAAQNALVTERMTRILDIQQQAAHQQQVAQQQAQQAEQQAAIPDKETHPFEYMAYLESQVAEVRQTQQETQQQTQQERQQAELWESGNSQARQFRATLEKPEQYDEAYNFAMQKRGEELLAMGTPRDHIAGILQNEVFSGMQYAMQNKINPGKMLYDLAIARGYTPAQAQQAQQSAQQAQQQPNGQQQAQAQAPASQMTPEQLAAAQAANRSMSNTGGVRGPVSTYEDVANMSEEDFEVWLEKAGDKGLATLHGIS